MSDTLGSLRHKLSGARQLASVVKAMKTVAAASVGEYEAAAEALTHYQRTVDLALGACLRNAGHQAMAAPLARDAATGALVFGSDQGLVGRFNENVGDLVLQTLQAITGPKLVWAVGERVASYLELNGVPVARQFATPGSAPAIAALVAEVQLEVEVPVAAGRCREVSVFHNQPDRGMRFVASRRRLLPLDAEWRERLRNEPWPAARCVEVLAGVESTLAGLAREQLFISLYRACAESLASENRSRLNAMQRAQKNIDSVSRDLQQSVNHVRQSTIDAELFDLIAGFDRTPARTTQRTKGNGTSATAYNTPQRPTEAPEAPRLSSRVS